MPVVQFTRAQNPNAPSPNLGGIINTTADDSMLVGFAAINAGFNNVFSNDGVTAFAKASTNIMNYAGGYKQAPNTGPNPFTWVTNGFSSGIGTTAIAEVRAAV